MKRLVSIITASLFLLPLAACAANTDNVNVKTDKVFAAFDLSAAPLLATEWDKEYPAISTNDFAIKMKCDTPFVFVLTGSSGDVLFTGIVNQP